MEKYYNPAGNAGGQFRDVLIRNNIGYFGVDDSSSLLGGVHIVNLADPNPANWVKIADINGNNNGFHRTHDLFLDGDFLYLASNLNTTIKVFNVSNPALPTFVRNIVTTGTPT